MAAEPDKVRVALLAGAGFSGTTLLEQALSQIDGCVSIGGIHPLFERYWPLMTCECGQEFRTCPFWQAVLADAYGDDQYVARERVRVLSQGFPAHSVWAALTHAKKKWSLSSAFEEIGSLIEPLYRAIVARTGAEVIVDASKSAFWGLCTMTAPGVDLEVVHLVKDPRAFAWSNGRPHYYFYPPGSQTVPRSPARSYVNWALTNIEADYLERRVPRSTTVLYETLARYPEQTVASIAEMIGLGGQRAADPRRQADGQQDRPRHGWQRAPAAARNDRDRVRRTVEDARLRELQTLGQLMGPLWNYYRHAAARRSPEAASAA